MLQVLKKKHFLKLHQNLNFYGDALHGPWRTFP